MKPLQSKEPTQSKKNNMVQIFRAFAIIAVVMIHTSPKGDLQVICRPFVNFAVATFFFLSGYLTNIENDDWGKFFKRRITRVLIPYIIWTIIFTIPKGLINLPYNLLTAKAAVPLYYILVYIQFVLLTPLLGKLAKTRYQYLGWFVTPISAIILMYYWVFSGNKPSSFISLLWVDSCLAWFTFYYLGLLLGNHIIEKKYSMRILVILYIVSILVQIGEGYGLLMLGETNYGTQRKFSSYLTSTLFLLIMYNILENKQLDIRSRILRLLGDYSFGIYLCHILVIKALNYIPYYRSMPYLINSLVVLLLSFIICYVGDKLCGEKISRWCGFK